MLKNFLRRLAGAPERQTVEPAPGPAPKPAASRPAAPKPVVPAARPAAPAARPAAPNSTAVRRPPRVVAPPKQGRHLAYAPDLDGDADPGEIVWTWVPYEDDPAQ